MILYIFCHILVEEEERVVQANPVIQEEASGKIYIIFDYY